MAGKKGRSGTDHSTTAPKPGERNDGRLKAASTSAPVAPDTENGPSPLDLYARADINDPGRSNLRQGIMRCAYGAERGSEERRA